MLIRSIAKTLILPPALQLVCIALAIVCWRRYPKISRALGLLGLISLWLLALPVVSWSLQRGLEWNYAPIDLTQAASAQAIVVLGAGRRREAPEYGYQDTVNRLALERLRYAATLHRQTELPVLVSGGSVFREDARPEAEMMADTLIQEFGVPVEWREGGSRNTAENGLHSYALLADQGFSRILLVTHSWHMARAERVFQNAGFEVVPAGLGFARQQLGPEVLDFLPSANALRSSRYMLHEWLGGWVYRLSP
ncbi:YdcF family protein [Pseudomaricurvus alkylphenolicus]|uniref:YdcF family protein n=1 Tax=Pseudomaricurvus alkylphenolicus TaxID=1306991 RepID=UPI00141FFA48|nr:YdcF family protein [Pseudomaricurvus alkylphenolicus]NIB40114.1 YdcF family protein [Pseudomaricurvus alkylphenolicus]